MNNRILVAGIGNIFLGDDAFGVEVVRALGSRVLPAGVRVKDFGIRSFDLAYALLEPWEEVILVDAVPRGGTPGTLYMIEPDLNSVMTAADTEFDAHTMDPVKVLRLASSMGEITARIHLIGCEPEDVGEEFEGRMGLSEPVQSAVNEAAAMVEDLVGQLVVPN